MRLKCTKFNFGPDLLAGFKGPTSKEREGREGKRRDGEGREGRKRREGERGR